MSFVKPIDYPKRLPETIVSTDAIEQLSPFVSVPGDSSEHFQPHWRNRDYLLGSFCLGQKSLTALPLLFGDLLTILGCHYLAAGFVIALLGYSLPPDYLLQGWATAIVFVTVGLIVGLYPATAISPVIELRQTVITAWLAFATIVLLNQMLATLSLFEVIVGVTGALFATIVAPLMRNVVRRQFSNYTWWGERVIIVGSGAKGRAIYNFYKQNRRLGLRPLGVVVTSENEESNQRRHHNSSIPHLGRLDQTAFFALNGYAHWCIIALDQHDESRVQEVLRHCSKIPNIIILPTGVLLPSLWANSQECAGVIGLHLTDQLRNPIARIVKRSVDISAALAGLFATAPLFLLVFCWIKIASPGPVLFTQNRVGRDGKTFRMLKFRSMVMDADKRLEDLLDQDPSLRIEWFETQKLKDDPRIIKGIGKLLRKSSLDELPQLWNVLVGDMSLVGPRPVPVYEEKLYREYDTQYQLYLRVTPGITGLWQVSGRNHTSYIQRVRLDAYYVCNWSPWLDFYILLRTIRTVIFAEGAY